MPSVFKSKQKNHYFLEFIIDFQNNFKWPEHKIITWEKLHNNQGTSLLCFGMKCRASAQPAAKGSSTEFKFSNNNWTINFSGGKGLLGIVRKIKQHQWDLHTMAEILISRVGSCPPPPICIRVLGVQRRGCCWNHTSWVSTLTLPRVNALQRTGL